MQNRTVFRLFFLTDRGEIEVVLPLPSAIRSWAAQRVAERKLALDGIDPSGLFCTGIEVM